MPAPIRIDLLFNTSQATAQARTFTDDFKSSFEASTRSFLSSFESEFTNTLSRMSRLFGTSFTGGFGGIQSPNTSAPSGPGIGNERVEQLLGSLVSGSEAQIGALERMSERLSMLGTRLEMAPIGGGGTPNDGLNSSLMSLAASVQELAASTSGRGGGSRGTASPDLSDVSGYHQIAAYEKTRQQMLEVQVQSSMAADAAAANEQIARQRALASQQAIYQAATSYSPDLYISGTSRNSNIDDLNRAEQIRQSRLQQSSQSAIGRFDSLGSANGGMEETIDRLWEVIQNPPETMMSRYSRQMDEIAAQAPGPATAMGLYGEQDAHVAAYGQNMAAETMSSQWPRPLADQMAANNRAAMYAQAEQAAQERIAGRSEYNAALSEGGIFSPGFRGDGTGNGASRVAGLFTNAQTVKINADGSGFTHAIQEGTSQWEQFVHRITGDGGKVSQVYNLIGNAAHGMLSPLRGAMSLFEGIGNQAIRLSAIFYSFERIGNILRAAIEGPFDKVISASEEAMKFRMSITGTFGGRGNAAAVNDQVIGQSRDLPIDLSDIRRLTEDVSHIPALATEFALGSKDASAQKISQLVDIVARLEVANPQKTSAEIIDAIDRAMKGNPRGLRSIAQIDPKELEDASGKDQKGLTSDKNAFLAALEEISKQRTPDGILADAGALPSLQWKKFVDQFTVGMERIGNDSGLFWEVSHKFGSMVQEMGKYVDSKDFRNQASEIGNDMMIVFDNVMHAIRRLLGDASGAVNEKDVPNAVVSQVKLMTDSIAKASYNLEPFASSIGTAFNGIITGIQAFLISLSQAGLTAAELAQRGQNYSNRSWWSLATGSNDDWDARKNELQQQAVLERMQSMTGRQVGNMVYGQHFSGTKDEFDQEKDDGPFDSIVDVVERFKNKMVRDQYMHADITDPKDKAAFDAAFADVREHELRVVDGKQLPSFINNPEVVDALKNRLAENGVTFAAPNDTSAFGAGSSIANAFNLASSQGRLYAKNQSGYDRLGVDEDLQRGSKGIYSTALSGMISNFDSISGNTPSKFEKLADSMTSFESVMNRATLAKTNTPSYVDELIDWENRRIAELKQKRASLSEDMKAATDPGVREKYKQDIANIDKDMELIAGGLTEAIKSLLETGRKATGKMEEMVIEQSKSMDPAGRKNFVDAIFAQYGNQMTPAEMAGSYQERTKLDVAGITADANRRMAPQSGSLMFGNGLDNNLLNYYQKTALPRAQGVVDKAQAAYSASGTPADLLALKDAQGELQQTQFQVQELANKTNLARQAFVDFGNGAQTAVEHSIGQSLTDLETHAGNLSKVFKDLSLELLNLFNQAMVKSIFNSVIGSPDSGGKSGGGGLLANLFNLAGNGGGTKTSETGGSGPPIYSAGNEPGMQGGSLLGMGIQSIGKWARGPLAPGTPVDVNGNPVDLNADAAGGGGDLAQPNWLSGIGQGLGNIGSGIGGLANGFGSFLGGAASAVGSAASGIGSGIGSLFAMLPSLFAADGAVFPGGFTAFAHGGVATRPTLGLVGERSDGVHEAIIPMLGSGGRIPLGMDGGGVHAVLPGGRKIGATFADGGVAEGGISGDYSNDHFASGASHGGSGGSQHLTIVNLADKEELANFTLQKHGPVIVNHVISQFGPGGKGRQVLKKH